MTYNIDVHTPKKISQHVKCRRLKKSIFPSLLIINEKRQINDYNFSITLKLKRQREQEGERPRDGEGEVENESERQREKS